MRRSEIVLRRDRSERRIQLSPFASLLATVLVVALAVALIALAVVLGSLVLGIALAVALTALAITALRSAFSKFWR